MKMKLVLVVLLLGFMGCSNPFGLNVSIEQRVRKNKFGDTKSTISTLVLVKGFDYRKIEDSRYDWNVLEDFIEVVKIDHINELMPICDAIAKTIENGTYKSRKVKTETIKCSFCQ